MAISGTVGMVVMWLEYRRQNRYQTAPVAPGATRKTIWGVGAILPGNAPLDANRSTKRDMEFRL